MKKKYVAFCIADLKHLAESINGNRLLLKKLVKILINYLL